MLAPNFESMPAELRARPHWVCWRMEAGRKVPYDPRFLSRRASSTDRDTWASFDEAMTAYQEREGESDAFSGVGFVVTADGVAGIDLDHCITDGTPDPRALALLETMGAAYVERSPSGTGLRAFGLAAPLMSGCKGQYDGLDVELYTEARYLTLTGHTLKAAPLAPLQGFAELAERIRAGRKIDRATGEIIMAAPDDRQAELVRRILSGDVYHDSLRDLAASLVATGMQAGAVVNHLRGLMDNADAPRDDRWAARRRQIPELVTSACRKFEPPTEQVQQQGPRYRLAERTAARLFKGEPPPVKWLVKGILPRGVSTLLASPPNVGKSFLALDLATKVARTPGGNLPAFALGGQVACHGRAVYVSAEDDEPEIHRRLWSLCAGSMPDRLHVLSLPDVGHFGIIEADRHSKEFRPTAAWRELAEEIRALPDVHLVVLDTLQALTSGDTNTAEATQPLMNEAAALASATGACVMLIHHVAKGSTREIKSALDAMEAIRGSGAIAGSARAAYVLWPPSDGGRKVCEVLGVEHKEGRVAFGLVAKAYGDARRDRSVFVRDESGILRDRTDAFNALSGGDTDSMRGELLHAIRKAWAAGEAFAASQGNNGMHARRFEMAESFHEKPRGWFEEQAGRLLADGAIKRMPWRGGARLVPADAQSVMPQTVAPPWEEAEALEAEA